jgi:hypothetical protein
MLGHLVERLMCRTSVMSSTLLDIGAQGGLLTYSEGREMAT